MQSTKVQVAFLIVITIFLVACLRLIYQAVVAFKGSEMRYDGESTSSELMKSLFGVLLFGLLAMLTYGNQDDSSDKTEDSTTPEAEPESD